MAKPQTRWAVVLNNGHIDHFWMAFTRKGAIENAVKEYRSYSNPKFNGAGLTDAQLWRQIKTRRNCTVQRLSLIHI